MFEGTDNRENLQKTLGQLTQQIQLLDGLKIKISDATEVQIKLYCPKQHTWQAEPFSYIS